MNHRKYIIKNRRYRGIDMDLTMLVAIADNDVIGFQGKIPWHLTTDMKRFKRLTMGKCVIVGRRTFESLPKLSGRRLFVVTSDINNISKPTSNIDAAFFNTPEKAVLSAFATSRIMGSGEIIVAGGKTIYEALEPYITKAIVTMVRSSPLGDTVYSLSIKNSAWWVWNTIERGDPVVDNDTESKVVVGRRMWV